MKDKALPLDFNKVIEAELPQLNARRARREIQYTDRDVGNPELVGLSLSGGGIRSASICLGAIQALRAADALDRFDYLSTVSGGGYVGCGLSVAMSDTAGAEYPFGDDFRDSRVVAHLRNYSNYLLPRDRSSIRNWLEAAAIILRGLVANAICVSAFLLAGVILTAVAFPVTSALHDLNFLPRLCAGVAGIAGRHVPPLCHAPWPMSIERVLVAALLIVLTVWAMLRSLTIFDKATNDTAGLFLKSSLAILVLLLITLFLDLQPLIIRIVMGTQAAMRNPTVVRALPIAAAVALAALAFFAGRAGRFLETSTRARGAGSTSLRILTQLLIIAGAFILPLLIWVVYALVYSWAIATPGEISWGLPRGKSNFDYVVIACGVASLITCFLRSNNYILHWLYRDRLSHAFLVASAKTDAGGKNDAGHGHRHDIEWYDDIKLSQLQFGTGPFHIINAALNVEGSLEANKRGRNADFFSFTPLHIGSELTGYVTVEQMERVDHRLDVAGAMAISGAAASANMGSSTIRVLSPTLSLMNVRLGYYLENPRFIGRSPARYSLIRAVRRKIWDQFFLLVEMLNLLTEDRSTVYLTDGGHIENLGVYELLKRQCRLIIAIDAEADPDVGCGSLLKLERYARIDLGIRIVLPWEKIARESHRVSDCLWSESPVCDNGPHCAVGRIFYPDETDGIIVYIKSSLSGDEKDYVLDYAKRNASFPHESTSDQFFSEEQFEMYRALGFHMVDGLFRHDHISFVEGLPYGFDDEESARTAFTKTFRPRVATTNAAS